MQVRFQVSINACLNCFDMCNVVSGLVCVLFSTFVTGLTVESFSIYCASVSCVGKVVYNYLTCSFVLNSIGNLILDQIFAQTTAVK